MIQKLDDSADNNEDQFSINEPNEAKKLDASTDNKQFKDESDQSSIYSKLINEPNEAKKLDASTDNKQFKDESDEDSVQIIDYGSNFSPYKSQLEREFNEERLERQFEPQRKRKIAHQKRNIALENWKWDEVITLSDDSEDEFSDTAVSVLPVRKFPRVTIHKRHRVVRLVDESDEEET